jgi:peptidoglycan-N-acetylglucosamine deacetylase
VPPARFAVYAASAAVGVVAARAAFGRAPPFGWSVAMLAAYVTLVLAGVFVLRWRVFVDAVVRGPDGAPGVVLTFDDGPHPSWTPRILEALSRHGVRATFFVIGRKVEQHPDVVRAVVAHGHDVGLHSYEHDRLFALRGERRVRQDLERGLAAIEKVTGKRPILFRPPIGHSNPITARVADALDLVVVGWTVGGRDGTSWASPKDVVARVVRGVRDGAIVLLHDAPERDDREPAAVAALPAILDALDARRLPVVPLSGWIDALHGEAGAGSTT